MNDHAPMQGEEGGVMRDVERYFWRIGFAFLSLALLSGAPCSAALITVDTNIDEANTVNGNCTFREAVQAANTNTAEDGCTAGSAEPIPDIINLVGAGGDIVLTQGALNLNTTITVEGPATIDGNNATRIFTVGGSGIAILNLLVLTQGDSGAGAAVQNNDGILTITGCSLTDNVGSSNGGAISSTGTLIITGSILSGNTSGADGGAVHQAGSDDATITATAFTSNSADEKGGALYVSGGSLATVTDCLFTTNNGADDSGSDETDGGGAIFVANNGDLDLSASVLDANVSTEGRGGAIYVQLSAGTVTIADCSFDANVTMTDGDPAGSEPRNGRGGAIYNQEAITVDRCTFNGNIAPFSDGGAIANHRQGVAVVTNCSFFLNGAGINGGAIHNADDEFPGGGQSTVELRNCTFDQNDADLHINPLINGVGGSIYNDETVELWNTIVASGDPQNCAGSAVVSNGYNLETGTDCGFASTGDLQSTDPQLQPPGFNGGPPGLTFLLPPFFFTQDMAAMAPPLGAGDPAVCAAAPVGGVDQVGNSRPQGGGPACDMGSYESGQVPVELVSFTID